MIKNFKELKVWQKSHELTLEIYEISSKFPKEEMYGLVSQMRRCAVSMSANIVEGCKRQTTLDFCHFLNISEGSLEELKYHLLLSRDLKFLTETKYEELTSRCEEVGQMLSGLVSSLKKRNLLAATRLPLLLLLTFLTAYRLSLTTAGAESFKILGSRPLGMGGAFVAVAEDSLAQYWNPAGLAAQKKFDLEIPVGARAEFTAGILKDVNSVADLASQYSKVQNAQRNGSAIDAAQVASIFKTLGTVESLNQQGKGVLIDAGGGMNLRIARIAVSVNNFTSAGAAPFMDTVNLGLGSSGSSIQGIRFTDGGTVPAAEQSAPSRLTFERDKVKTVLDELRTTLSNAGISIDASLDNTELANALINKAINLGVSDADITNAVNQIEANKDTAKKILTNVASGKPYLENQSNLTLRGIMLFEIAAGYAHRFFLEDLYLGGNIKALIGRVGFSKINFLNQNVSGNDALSKFTQDSKQSIQPGIDLGLLYDKRESWRMKFGLVGRNLNSPTFAQPDSAEGEQNYRVQPQLRAGVAVYPLKRKFWVISSDLDLTNNITAVPGFSSRVWALGTEIDLPFIPALRAGIMNNLAESNSKLSYTAGLGFQLFGFFLDISGAISSQVEEIKSGENQSQKVPQNFQIAFALGLNF